MRVQSTQDRDHTITFELLDDADQPIAVVSGFMRHLRARGYSPNTLSAYAYDLLHFMTFLAQQHITHEQFTPASAWRFLEYLREAPSRKRAQRFDLVLCTTDQGSSTTTINRVFAAVSSFYEYLILTDQFFDKENPIHKVNDPALAHVSERHRPFMGTASRQRPVRRAVRVKTVQRVPRPMSEEQVEALPTSLRFKRDRAMILLMLHGGLRPGEVLNLHLEDISYGRRRVVIRYRNDHQNPPGSTPKSLILLSLLNIGKHLERRRTNEPLIRFKQSIC